MPDRGALGAPEMTATAPPGHHEGDTPPSPRRLSNLRARMASDTDDALRRALTEEWKGNAEGVLLVLEALRAGRIADQAAGDISGGP